MRDLLQLSNQDIEAAFAREFDIRVRLDGDQPSPIVFTLDPLDSFVNSARRFHDYAQLERGERTLVIEKAKVHRRDQPNDMFVIDFGDVRAYYRR